MWKGLVIAVAEFLGGLGSLRVGVPAENLALLGVGLGLTLLGLAGLVKPLAKPQAPRPYP